MKILVDSKRQLNYHPLVVYFMLKPKDIKQYGKHIKALNRYLGFTRGIFTFRAVTRGNEYSHGLTNDLIAEINKFNVILRLVDDDEGNFNYALGRINLNQDPALFEAGLQRFVVDACKWNVKTLNDQYYYSEDDSQESHEYASVVSSIAQGFKDAISLKGFKFGVWQNLLNPKEKVIKVCEEKLLIESDANDIDSVDWKRKRDSFYSNLPSRELKEQFKELMAQGYRVPTIDQSDKYAMGTVDHSKSKSLIEYQKSNANPAVTPEVTIAIARVDATRNKKGWGVKINVDGETIPVYISSSSATMVYICTLLKHSMGTTLSRSVFRKNNMQHEDVTWLKDVYRTVYPGAKEDFSDWYLKQRDGVECKDPMALRGISQGKAQANDAIRSNLKGYPSIVFDTCRIMKKDANPTAYYYLDISPECIIVPKEFRHLIVG